MLTITALTLSLPEGLLLYLLSSFTLSFNSLRVVSLHVVVVRGGGAEQDADLHIYRCKLMPLVQRVAEDQGWQVPFMGTSRSLISLSTCSRPTHDLSSVLLERVTRVNARLRRWATALA